MEITNTESKNSLIELGKNLIRSSNKRTEEKNLIIIGDKSSGKTSIYNSLTQSSIKETTYTPTCGINYSYMRYQPSTAKKFILNIYEIGGDISNIDLTRTILTQQNIMNTIFLLILDFSNPAMILESFKAYTKALNSIIKDICDQDTLMGIIEQKRTKYKDINSNDFKRITFFPCELIVIGNKYDILERIEAERIKWTCRALRYFCHVNSLSLVYMKAGDIKLSKLLSNLITGIAFGMNNSEYNQSIIEKNDIHPLFILYGNDCLNEIGDPKVIQQGQRELSLLWEDTFSTVFKFEKENEKKNYDELENKMKNVYKEARLDEEVLIFE